MSSSSIMYTCILFAADIHANDISGQDEMLSLAGLEDRRRGK